MWRVAAIAICSVGPAWAGAEAAPPVVHLIEQLGSEDYVSRETAMAALEKLGAAAIPSLQVAARSENPEVRERAGTLLLRIRRTVDHRVRLTPRTVALDFKNIPLGTAVHDLRFRTGLNLRLDPGGVADPLRPVSCRTADVPVWEALEAFCTAAGLRERFVKDLELPKAKGPRGRGAIPPLDPQPDSVPIVLIDGKPDRLPGSRSSAVRVLALPPTFSGHRVSLGTGEYGLCLDVTPVPGLNWQGASGVRITRVVDSSGRRGTVGIDRNPLPIFDPTGVFIFARPGVAIRFDNQGNPVPPETIPNPRVVTVPIRIATATAHSLRRFEGSVLGEIKLVNQHLVTIGALRSNIGRVQEGPEDLKVSLQDLREATAGTPGIIRIQMEFPSPWVLHARRHRLDPAFNPGLWTEPSQAAGGRTIYLLDAAGRSIPVQGSSFRDDSDDGMTITQTLQFTIRRESGMPAKIVVAGSRTVQVEVPFVMENVRLP